MWVFKLVLNFRLLHLRNKQWKQIDESLKEIQIETHFFIGKNNKLFGDSKLLNSNVWIIFFSFNVVGFVFQMFLPFFYLFHISFSFGTDFLVFLLLNLFLTPLFLWVSDICCDFVWYWHSTSGLHGRHYRKSYRYRCHICRCGRSWVFNLQGTCLLFNFTNAIYVHWGTQYTNVYWAKTISLYLLLFLFILFLREGC